jgi:hypothetical protein
MTHVDHHTLELYVLQSASLGRKRQSIARHLARCSHCRAIADEIRLIYIQAAAHVQPTRDVPIGSTESLAPWKEHFVTSRNYDDRPLVRVDRSGVQRVLQFYRSHPVLASAVTLTSLVIMVLAATTLVRWVAPTPNPAKVHYDTSRDILEVYDEKDNLLWLKPSRGLKRFQEEEGQGGGQFAVIGDLDGNRRNEVVTMIPIEATNTQPITNAIRIYGSTGDVLASTSLGERVRFSGQTYQASQFWAGGLTLVRNPTGAGKEIVAAARHYRSPSVVARLDARGKVLGQYWHQGHVWPLHTIESPDSSRQWVLLKGCNDADTSDGGKIPVILVLDASKILGTSEASATRGFGFPASSAEVAYIRFPRSDIDYALHGLVEVKKVLQGEGERWSFIVAGIDSTNGSSFEYVFGPDWRIETVLSSDTNTRVHARLREKGLVHGQIDQRYLDNLKSSVEYWDGQRWVRGYTVVQGASPSQEP